MPDRRDRRDQPTVEPSLGQQTRTLRIVWLGLVQAGLVYAAVAWLVRGAETPPSPVLVYAVAVVSGVTSASSFALRPVLLSPQRLARTLAVGGSAAALQAIVQGHLIAWALADSCAILGLVLGVLGAPALPTFGPIILGTALVIAQGPTAHTIPDLLAAAETERLRSGGGDQPRDRAARRDVVN